MSMRDLVVHLSVNHLQVLGILVPLGGPTLLLA